VRLSPGVVAAPRHLLCAPFRFSRVIDATCVPGRDDNSILPWLKKRDVALIVWETAGYSPQPQGDLFRNAVHNFVQAILGIHILDRADLEALSEAAASRNRWEFMLTVTPLALPNATGSPVNPIAMF
jgi:hypothetical protein